MRRFLYLQALSAFSILSGIWCDINAQTSGFTDIAGGVVTYCMVNENANPQFQIYSINANGTGNSKLLNCTLSLNEPEYSPDGKFLVVSGFTGNDYVNISIYKYTFSTGILQRLTTTANVMDNHPTFSPDGLLIAFSRRYPPSWDTDEIWMMNNDGSNLHPIGLEGYHVQFSPDGTRLAYASDVSENWEIYTCTLDGTEVQNLTNNPSVDCDPSWSPDGHTIAFGSNRDGNGEIYIMNADGTQVQRLTNNTADDTGPAWSPDGDRITFGSERQGTMKWQVFVMNSDGTDVRQVTNVASPGRAQEPVWRPILTGPYLGQPGPGVIPVLFAPSVIVPGQFQYGYFGITFSPDGKECFYGNYPEILRTKETGNGWPIPVTAPFSGSYGDMEACITPDNSRLYFVSDRPLAGAPQNIGRLWYVDRTDTGWSVPIPIEQPLRDIMLMFPSLTESGDLYLSTTDNIDQWISVSRFVDGHYQALEKLSDSINFNPYAGHSFIAPDERYMIYDVLDHMAGEKPCRDLYVSFRKQDGSWTTARSMGDTINTYDGNEVCPFVSQDDKYLFFTRDGNLYWVNTPAMLHNVGMDEELHGMPGMELKQNYPNPVDHMTTFEFSLTKREHMHLKLYDVNGQEILSILDKDEDPGIYRINFDLGFLPGGVYRVTLTNRIYSISKPLVKL